MNLDTEFEGLTVAEAAFYTRLGLQLEVITLADVSDWVDEALLREGDPATFFLRLYPLLRTGKSEVPTYLRTAFPAANYSVRPGLAWLYNQLVGGCWSLGQIIKSLYRLRTLVRTDEEVGWIYALAADYERASAEPSEVIQKVKQETTAFLTCYQDYTFDNRAQWHGLDLLLEQRLAKLRP